MPDPVSIDAAILFIDRTTTKDAYRFGRTEPTPLSSAPRIARGGSALDLPGAAGQPAPVLALKAQEPAGLLYRDRPRGSEKRRIRVAETKGDLDTLRRRERQ